jgi:hypothetical protein
MTTRQKRTTFLAISWAIIVVANVKGRAADVLLNRNDIQTLRYLEQHDHPAVIKNLSQVGVKTLFGERGLGIEAVLVESSGLWRWRWPHDTSLSRGEQGEITDALLLSGLLNRTAGPVAGTKFVIKQSELHALEWNHDLATIRIARGGSAQLIGDHYKKLVQHGMNLWESLDYPSNRKTHVGWLTGDMLQELPGDDVDKLFPDKKTKKLVGDWVELARQREKRLPSYFDDARTADSAELSEITLPTNFDFERGQLSFPCSPRRIDSSTNIYKLPLEPGKNLWLKVKAEASPKSTEWELLDAATLLAWMKDGKIEMCYQNNDVPTKVSPNQWERQIQIMEKRLAPQK